MAESRVSMEADRQYASAESLFENPGSGPITRREWAQKRSVHVVREHFEAISNGR
jgi:hypothetical protein